MAIAKIKKLEIIGLQEEKENILSLLQKLGIVELTNIQEIGLTENPHLVNEDINLLETEEAISYLASFRKEAGFLRGMIKLKPLVYEEELKEVIANFDYHKFLKELSELRSHLKILLQHEESLIQERHLLIPWHKLRIPLDEMHDAQTCGTLLGVLHTSDYANLLDNCKEEDINLFCDVVKKDKINTYLAIVYLKEEFERLEGILKNHHFNFITLSHHKSTVEGRLLEINREVPVLDGQIEEAKEKIAKLSEDSLKVEIIYDYLFNINKIKEAGNSLIKQQFTFILSGWIKASDAKLLEKTIDKFQNTAIFISEPDNEEVPVDLENNRIIEPFEFITKIYGFPKYNEIDPTPFLAPFFFLYFGFCVSDVGYGFVLVAVAWFVLKKFKMGSQGLRFFRLFLFCGISTIIIGALTGSWFGNLLDLAADSNKIFLPLKRFKDSLVILDPMKNPTRLLAIALSFGIIQVWFGNIVAAIGNIKNKRYLAIALDQIPMLTLLFGLTGLGLIFLQLFNKTQINLFKYASLLGGLILMFTQGRSEKGLGFKLFYGIYNLYSALSGYLSDILSYSRLWALSLVTGVMASTINLISIQFSQIFSSIIPFIDKIGFIKVLVSSLILGVIFISGHLVSFLMNLLGAFVHPLRLQFVEFFSKFFKAGGNSFQPFKLETKYTTFD